MTTGSHSPFCRTRVLTGVLALTLALLFPKEAVCADNCGTVDRLTVALRFSQAIYPELKEKELSVSFSEGRGTFVSDPTEADNFMIRVGEPIWTPEGETLDQYYAAQLGAVRSSGIELPLSLSFSFAKAGPSVKQRQLACRPVNFTSTAGYPQIEQVRGSLDPHPDWSDAQELEAARKLGLRYGPEEKRELLKNFPLAELTNFYGKLRVESAEFLINGGRKCTGCSFAYPRWQINLSRGGTSAGGIEVIVEPYFGRITSISE